MTLCCGNHWKGTAHWWGYPFEPPESFSATVGRWNVRRLDHRCKILLLKRPSQAFIEWDQGFRRFGAAVLLCVLVDVLAAIVSVVVPGDIVFSDGWSANLAVWRS